MREICTSEYFGELSALDGQPRSSGIIAVTDVVIARMPKGVFRTTIHSYPDVCDQVLATLASQIRILSNRINEFSNLDVRHRIYAELLRLSRPVPSNSKRRGSFHHLRFIQKSLLGSARAVRQFRARSRRSNVLV